MTSPALRRAAPFAAAVAVLAVVAAATYVFRDTGGAAGSSSQPPPPLRIGAATDREAAAADSRFTVTGELPDGPEEAPVRRFTDGDADVARLAEAVGVDPDDVAGGAAAQTDGSDVLRVGPGPARPWQFVRADAAVCLSPLPGASPDSPVSSCAVPPARGRPAVQPPPSEQEARDVAAPVLDAVGLDVADAVVGEPGATGDTRTVQVDPRIGDGPTSGVATSVTVDADGVVAAEGWLGATEEGDRYPVITAEAALGRLAAMPVPLIGCAEGEQRPGPLCGGPLEVTGASFGLSLQHEGEQPLLVPSWLFEVAGGPEPLAVVAVDGAYLDPVAGSGSSGSGTDGSSGTGASPGTAEPAPVDPVAPKVEPSAGASRFESVTVSPAGDALTVTFYGGVEDCFSYEVRADENARTVVLRLVERNDPVKLCVAMAQRYERTVTLERPLGGRVVVDAETRLPLYPVRAER